MTENAQTWNPDRYAKHAHFVPTLGQAVLNLLDAKPGERILDLGWGDGVLSEKIVALGASVVGVDSSADMISAAKRRGIDARMMSGYELTFDHEFDAVFSNAALHWMSQDPDAVVAGVRRALKTGGRFVGEMGGHGNVAAIHVALIAILEVRGVANAASVSPWYYPTPADYSGKLERAGFRIESMQLIPRPTPLPTGMEGWLKTFASPFLKHLREAQHKAAIAETVALLRPALCDEKGNWTADYVRLRFDARGK